MSIIKKMPNVAQYILKTHTKKIQKNHEKRKNGIKIVQIFHELLEAPWYIC